MISTLRARAALLVMLSGVGALGGQSGAAPRAPGARAASIAKYRAVGIAPRKAAPDWMDWSRVEGALRFEASKGQTIGMILSTTSLVSTYAAVDIAPVLIRTGRLVNDSPRRLAETGAWVQEMTGQAASRDEFVAKNYRRAYELGMLHAGLSRTITAEALGWKADERVTFNQQAYAFVLYTFAWEPIEAMTAMHMVEAARDREALEDWLYLWRVLGYAMGVDEKLLPAGLDQARETAALLRQAQYAAPGEAAPEGVPALLRGELTAIEANLAAGRKEPEAKAGEAAAKILAQAIAVSPGLKEALGLGADPLAKLMELAGAGKSEP